MRVLGPLRVWRGDTELDLGPRQQRCLLALLLVRDGQPVGVTELVSQIWGSDPPATAVNTIHKGVGSLRRILEPGIPPRSSGSYLCRHGSGYRFVATAETLDLAAFRRLVAEAESDPGVALDRYLEALRLWRGQTGDLVSSSAVATAVFARVDGEMLDVAVRAAGIAMRLGRASEVLVPLRTAAGIGRFHEPVHASLVAVLAATGHRAEAVAHRREVSERLRGELGISPGPALREVHRRMSDRAGPLLQALVEGLRESSRIGAMVIAVDGRPGVGKSAIVRQFAHQSAGDFPDGRLYVDLRGDAGLPAIDALRSLVRELGGRAIAERETMDSLIERYRVLTVGKRLLVVLDSVADWSQARHLMPHSAESLVLLTSREPLTGPDAPRGVCRLPLPAYF
ncbi:hypothetical protein Acsp01_27970 [Actinoplanes sp. NBRC 101535]|nr:hypothetical protein Acsp01_27970 [Actinoplanes sp. NBRC 101535]